MKTIREYVESAPTANNEGITLVKTQIRQPNGELCYPLDLMTKQEFDPHEKRQQMYDLEIRAHQICVIHQATENSSPNSWELAPYAQVELTYDQLESIYDLNRRYTVKGLPHIDKNVFDHWFKLADLTKYLETYYQKQQKTIRFDGQNNLINEQNTLFIGSIKNINYEEVGNEIIVYVEIPERNDCDPIWPQINCDHYDTINEGWCIDAWEDDDPDAEGRVIAIVFDNRIRYFDERAISDNNVQELIRDVIKTNYLKDNPGVTV